MEKDVILQAPRRTYPPIKVWCLPDERAEIEANARATGLSLSCFLRQVGMGYEPRSVIDYDQATELLKVHADLGRLGGLLKMWLTNSERGHGQEISALIADIAKANKYLLEAATKIVRSS